MDRKMESEAINNQQSTINCAQCHQHARREIKGATHRRKLVGTKGEMAGKPSMAVYAINTAVGKWKAGPIPRFFRFSGSAGCAAAASSACGLRRAVTPSERVAPSPQPAQRSAAHPARILSFLLPSLLLPTNRRSHSVHASLLYLVPFSLFSCSRPLSLTLPLSLSSLFPYLFPAAFSSSLAHTPVDEPPPPPPRFLRLALSTSRGKCCSCQKPPSSPEQIMLDTIVHVSAGAGAGADRRNSRHELG